MKSIHRAMNIQKPSAKAVGWGKSFLWLIIAVACFHAAYASIRHPAARLLIFGYALGLVRLADQPTVRRAFYFGLATGFLCYAPQLYFIGDLFGPAAIVLWIVLAFWVGLFTAIVCGAIRRWGRAKVLWLIPAVWTGVEYFRSELYILKFSWLNIGYALPGYFSGIGPYHLGMYGIGFVVFLVAAAYPYKFLFKMTLLEWIVVIVILLVLSSLSVVGLREIHSFPGIVGVQLEFPNANILPKVLNHALAKNPDAPLFVLSEYTLEGPVPDSLKNWCREHSRFLVVGGEELLGTTNFYDTAFVVGTNGEIVFQQVKCVPIQFFKDGLPAKEQKVWNSPWGKIGFCVCYDLSYTRVTDELVRQGAQLLIVPTMDVQEWGRHEHELHARVAPVRAAEYGIPIFRLASSGISQAVSWDGEVIAQAPFPGSDDIIAAELPLLSKGSVPLDRYLAPVCVGLTGVLTAVLLFLTWHEKPAGRKN